MSSFLESCEQMQDYGLRVCRPQVHLEERLTYEKIDKVFGNKWWKRRFNNTSTDHFTRVASDHRPILVVIPLERNWVRRACQFKFQVAWLLNDSFTSLVKIG